MLSVSHLGKVFWSISITLLILYSKNNYGLCLHVYLMQTLVSRFHIMSICKAHMLMHNYVHRKIRTILAVIDDGAFISIYYNGEMFIV